MKHFVVNAMESVFGRWSDRSRHNSVITSIPSMKEAIQHIGRRWVVEDEDGASPIFILSAGWRSGSTLLQRLVLSDPTVLVWGEPYAHCDLVRKLADGLRVFGEQTPKEQFFVDYHLSKETAEAQLSSLWVANLYPMPRDLIGAHRAFFRRLFEQPASDLGYARWGFKDVRLSGDYARYLHFLFPKSKIVFLYRDPYAAYRSYRSFRAWYDVWPQKPVLTPRHFGRVWRELLTSHLEVCADVGGQLLRFEDLAAGAIDLQKLSRYLEVRVNTDVMDQPVVGNRAGRLSPVSGLEKTLLRSAVEPLASRMGYRPD